MKTILYISIVLNVIMTTILIVVVALKWNDVPVYVFAVGLSVIVYNVTILFALKPNVFDAWKWILKNRKGIDT